MKIAIVGAGLYGATIASQMVSYGNQVTVFEAEEVVGGNLRTEWCPEAGTHYSLYGAHIFHTNSENVWNFVNEFAEFNDYRHYVKGRTYHNRMVDLPFGMSMFSQLLGISTPAEAEAFFSAVKSSTVHGHDQSTIEGWCLANIGFELYNTVVKDYTEKQWGRACSELPASIIQRLPIRYSYDSTYFHNARYQGMPFTGYSRLVENMLDGATIELGQSVDLHRMDSLHDDYDHVFFSGTLDQLLNYHHGELSYRGLRFEHQIHNTDLLNGAPVVNDLTHDVHYTRQIEHKMFWPGPLVKKSHTIVTTEYPAAWKRGERAYYPLRDEESSILHQTYIDDALERWPRMTVGGRLGTFRYLDMDATIAQALKDARKLLGSNTK